jgi:putative ABC transport system permease protein
MTTLATLLRRLRVLPGRSRLHHDLDDEMQLHVALRREQLERDGVPRGEAAQMATRRFGNRLQLREHSVDAWGWTWIEQVMQDVRFGTRTLVRSPVFTATIVVTLALATGATTAIFSIVNGVLLRPLPFAAPDRLMQVYGRSWRSDQGLKVPDPLEGPIAAAELAEYRTQSTTFAAFAAYGLGVRHMTGSGEPERLTAVVGDRNFFTVLGAGALVGRTFHGDDPPDVAVISERLWVRRFNRNPSLPGTSIALDGRPFTIVGVMPDAFQFPYKAASLMAGALPESRTDVWTIIEPNPGIPMGGARYSVTGRLKPGVTVDAAAAELRTIATRIERDLYRGTDIRAGVRIVPLAEEVIAPISRSLWVLFAAVGLVLLATWTNVANLLLARLTVRFTEVATRAAVGAGSLRLARQFIVESLMLSTAGGIAAIAVAQWCLNVFATVAAAKVPRAQEVTLDWQAFVFLAVTSIASALVFGLAPSVWVARASLRTSSTTLTRGYARMRDVLVVVEVALAVVLAFSAAVMMSEAARLRRVPLGITTDNVVTLHVTPRTSAEDYYAIEERVAQLPGVRAAGFTQLVPLQNWGWEADFAVRGRPRDGRPIAGLRYVTPGYFKTLGIPIRDGRTFTAQDTSDAPRVIVVNEALVRRYLNGEHAVGLDLNRGQIVGVVGDVRQSGLEQPAGPEIFYPAAQNVTMASDIGMSLIVRTEGNPEPLVSSIRSAVRAINPSLAIFNVKTMSQVVDDALWEVNLYRWVIGLFATLVVVLAAIGLYGVMSYNVTARRREFAIRLALGSRPVRQVEIVLRRGLWLTLIGLAIGALLSAHALLSFNILPIGHPPDLRAFAATSALLVLVSVIACAVPAMRVAAVDPVTALREE